MVMEHAVPQSKPTSLARSLIDPLVVPKLPVFRIDKRKVMRASVVVELAVKFSLVLMAALARVDQTAPRY